MPIKQAAFKALRQNRKRRLRNLAIKNKLKRAIKAVRKAVAASDKPKAQEALKAATPVIDKASQKGVIKKNTAARLKSRLHKAVLKISSAP